MAPLVALTALATPGLPLPAWVSLGQGTVLSAPSVHTPGAAAWRYLVKLFVVPDESERCTTVMFVDGSETPGLSALIAASFHVLIWRWKIFAIVSAESCSLLRPLTL